MSNTETHDVAHGRQGIVAAPLDCSVDIRPVSGRSGDKS